MLPNYLINFIQVAFIRTCKNKYYHSLWIKKTLKLWYKENTSFCLNVGEWGSKITWTNLFWDFTGEDKMTKKGKYKFIFKKKIIFNLI